MLAIGDNVRIVEGPFYDFEGSAPRRGEGARYDINLRARRNR